MTKILRLNPQKYTIALVINEFKPLFGLSKTSYILDETKNKLILNHDFIPVPKSKQVNDYLKRWYCFWDFFGVKATIRNLGIENDIIYSHCEMGTLDNWSSSLISSSIAISIYNDKYLDYRKNIYKRIRGDNTPEEFQIKFHDALKLMISTYDKSCMSFATFVINRVISLHNQGI
jgi:hypothetical protein